MRWRVILLAFALALVGCKPKLPSDALSDVDGLSGGGDLTCAHRRDATTWCWGDNALNEHWGNEHAQSVALAGIVAGGLAALRYVTWRVERMA